MQDTKNSVLEDYQKLASDESAKKRRPRKEPNPAIQVKGSLIVDYVRMIRAYKEKDWDKYLEPQDWNIINGSVLTSRWYPFDSWSRMGKAVFIEIADSNLELVRDFGKIALDNFLEIYKHILIPDNATESLIRLAEARKLLIKGDSLDIKVIGSGPGWVRYKVIGPPDTVDPKLLEAFCHQIAGSAEGIVLRAGGKRPLSTVIKKRDFREIIIEWKARSLKKGN